VPFGIGPLELIIFLVILLVIFGPKRLPAAGRALGQGMREFKDSVTGKDKGDDHEDERSELSAAAAPPPPPAPARPAGTEDASGAFGRDD
jgi:sec-independent protein translocase protein TatA